MIEPIEMDAFDSHEDIDIPDDTEDKFPLLPERVDSRVETAIRRIDSGTRSNNSSKC